MRMYFKKKSTDRNNTLFFFVTKDVKGNNQIERKQKYLVPYYTIMSTAILP